MRAIDFMRELDGPDFETPGTVDCFKYGDENREVKTVVTCLTATPDVPMEARRLGADLIITHEPTYYTHVDEIRPSRLTDMKVAAVKEAGIPLCRYHDHMHFAADDRKLPGNGFQDRGFAGAVRPDQGDDLAAVDPDLNITDQWFPVIADGQ